jgi:adenosylcobinamide amidohydrolase
MTQAAIAVGAGWVMTQRPRWLVVSFDEPVRACSWAVVGGGIVETKHVAWLEVRNADLGPGVDPKRLLLERFRAEALEPGVGLLTSRAVATYTESTVTLHGTTARCVATVGLSNALRAGDPAVPSPGIGTINLLAYVDVPLSNEGLLEASAIATEAKCAVVLEAGLRSRQSGRPATGTGTDCSVVASPRAGRFTRLESYAGKHTLAGSVVGAAVERAVGEGVRRWLGEVGL